MAVKTKLPSTWETLIDNRSNDTKFMSRTCKIYNHKPLPIAVNSDEQCPCGRLIRRHSFTGGSLQTTAAQTNTVWNPPVRFFDDNIQSIPVPVNVYGALSSDGCKFLRIDSRLKLVNLYNLLLDNCGGKQPALLLSVYGGAKYFTMTERLEKEFIRGIVDAATMADAWILTTGISNGVSKLVGEGISHYRLLREYPTSVKCIGMTMWSTISESTRSELKRISKKYPPHFCDRQIPASVQEDKETIEPNHTHCILFDSGRLNEYLSDSHRNMLVAVACNDKNNGHTCNAVTIIVEGGTGTLEVLGNDIAAERPIVLIQGSGRLADVLATLVEQTSNPDLNQLWNPSDKEIENALDRFYPSILDEEISSAKKRIKNILKEEHRHLLHVFCLDRDKNVAEIIFKAIFSAKNKKKKEKDDKKKKEKDDKNKERRDDKTNEEKLLEEKLLEEKQHRKDEDKLVDLALEWNYFDGVLPILQARQGDMKKKIPELIKTDIIRQKELFQKSLEKNRSTFIEYFLSAGFDPLTLAEIQDTNLYQSPIVNLYDKSHAAMNTSHKKRVLTLFGKVPFNSIDNLDYKLNKFLGSFIEPIYSIKNDSLTNRIKTDLTNHMCSCFRSCRYISDDHSLLYFRKNVIPVQKHDKYTKHHMLRDLFLWSVFMDMSEMAKVLLLHVRSRICAALIASAIFKRYSQSSQTVDLQDKFRTQSLEFETYAAMSIVRCYEYNEKRACELLLRQIPLFGNVTCMQVAISSESMKLLETACFDQALNQVWYYKLSINNHLPSSKLLQIPSVCSLGLVSPFMIKYREEEENLSSDGHTDASSQQVTKIQGEGLSRKGINYYIDNQRTKVKGFTKYWTRFRYFHESPMVKMCYHFISYIFFLLVFSYMMLYHLDGRNTFVIPHWTEIYVIITVCTMFCEEVRKIYHEYDTRMVERWGSTGSSIVTVLSNVFFILPYFLFFFGLGFRYGSYNDGLLTTARIIWALDLELWYLRSLKFVMALKFLGPKLFMLKNMLRDLFAFVYMIFIAVAAYGIASRAMIFYKQVPFTGRGILSQIFYEPYWFIYGQVSDKQLLDDLISNDTAPGNAEATATHVLLAFHMLFINILLLNLLIAVFADSIGKVQQNTEFYWRYQRYSFVREYFERVPCAYPPLIIIPHIILLFLSIHRKCCSKFCRNQVTNETYVPISQRIAPIFKMISTDSQNEQWDLFENAATQSYARSVLEKNKSNLTTHDHESNRILNTIDSDVGKTTVDQQQVIANFKDDFMVTFKSALSETQKGLEQNNSRMENRLDQMSISLEWMMKAITRVKMNDPKEPRPAFELSPVRRDIPFEDQATTNSAQ